MTRRHTINRRHIALSIGQVAQILGLAALAGCGGVHRDAAPAQPRIYTLRTLASFTGQGLSRPELTLIGGTLYGTNADRVFSVPVGGGPITSLATFDTTRFQSATGYTPGSGLTPSADGATLYGTTYEGGPYGFFAGASGYGTVFSVPTAGGPITPLASFNGANGAHPRSHLVLSADGTTLYGTTTGGGGPDDASSEHFPQGNGTVFSISVAGGPITVLGTSFAAPGLTLLGSTFYGMSGSAMFSLPLSGGAFTPLAGFSGGLTEYATAALVPGPGGILYGTTTGSFPLRGQNLTGPGRVFAFNPHTGALVTLATFDVDGTNGLHPSGTLTLVGDTLYGTTSTGGPGKYGTVFSVPAAGGPVTTLVAFTGDNGGSPDAGLTLGPDGTLYGTTSEGGPGGAGTVFAMTPHAP